MSLSVGLLARDSTRIKGRNGSRIVGMRSEDRDKFQGEGEGHWFPPELSLWGGVGWVDQLYVDCRAGVLLESYWVASLMTYSTPPHPHPSPPPASTDLSAALQSTNSWSIPPHNNTSGRNHCPPSPRNLSWCDLPFSLQRLEISAGWAWNRWPIRDSIRRPTEHARLYLLKRAGVGPSIHTESFPEARAADFRFLRLEPWHRDRSRKKEPREVPLDLIY